MQGVSVAILNNKQELRKPRVIMQVAKENLEEMYKRCDGNIETYVCEVKAEEIDQMPNIVMKKHSYVSVKVPVSEVTAEVVSEIYTRIKAVNPSYVVVINVPDKFSDMRLLQSIGEQYGEDLRFCGGRICRVKGVYLGCIKDGKTVKNFLGMDGSCDNCGYCCEVLNTPENSNNIRFLEEKLVVRNKKRKPKEPKPPKVKRVKCGRYIKCDSTDF